MTVHFFLFSVPPALFRCCKFHSFQTVLYFPKIFADTIRFGRMKEIEFFPNLLLNINWTLLLDASMQAPRFIGNLSQHSQMRSFRKKRIVRSLNKDFQVKPPEQGISCMFHSMIFYSECEHINIRVTEYPTVNNSACGTALSVAIAAELYTSGIGRYNTLVYITSL